MAWNEKTRALSSIKRHLTAVCKKTETEIGQELKKAYNDSLELWWEKFVKWTKHKCEVPNFDFLRAASSAYNNDKFGPQLIGDIYEINLNVDPNRMHAGLKHQWGENKGDAFPDEDAFDMMYVNGVYGFNKEIVNKSWYRTQKSIDSYIKKTGAPDDITRDEIINKILKKRKFIPPIKRTSPEKIMKSKARKILDKNHVEDVMRKYLKDAELFNMKTRK